MLNRLTLSQNNAVDQDSVSPILNGTPIQLQNHRTRQYLKQERVSQSLRTTYGQIQPCESSETITNKTSEISHDWSLTPLFLSVYNQSHEWNQRHDQRLFFPLEVDYVIEMVKQSCSEFQKSDMVKPFFVKAKTTLTKIMTELGQTEILALMLDKYRELNLKNTLKLLYRCKLEFLTRNLMVGIFSEIMKYETHASMLKDLL